LQEREITPVGGAEVIAVNVRVIAASNKDLKKEMEQKRFRRRSVLQTQRCGFESATAERQERRYSSFGSAFPTNILQQKIIKISKASHHSQWRNL